MQSTVFDSIKKQWLAALRSGDYKQGKSKLKQDDRYCCLGVLCDLAVKAGVAEEFVSNDGLISFGDRLEFSKYAFLPSVVVEWAGLSEPNPTAPRVPLSEINDRGATFYEIADLIERYL